MIDYKLLTLFSAQFRLEPFCLLVKFFNLQLDVTLDVHLNHVCTKDSAAGTSFVHRDSVQEVMDSLTLLLISAV